MNSYKMISDRLASVKFGLALAVLSCVFSIEAQAQDKISLPGLLKGVMPRPSEVPPGTNSAAQPNAVAQPNEVKNSPTSGQSGSDSADSGFAAERPRSDATREGTVAFANKTLKGVFYSETNGSGGHKSGVLGYYLGGRFLINAYNENASHLLEFEIRDTLENFKKPPRTYKIETRVNEDPRIKITYEWWGLRCYAKVGDVTITSFGEVGEPMTGTISRLKWHEPKCDQELGSSATFKVYRALFKQ